MLENENTAIHPKYIKKPFINNNNCIKTATDYFGIEIEIAVDYETALEQLKENENGKCKFFAIWVICGPKINRVPNPKGDPSLINNFIKVLQNFWNNGGSIIFFADGDPHFFQVNEFLKTTKFKDENGNLKYVEFNICGNDEGEQKLIRDETGELKYNKCFDGKKIKDENNILIPNLGANILYIYEGKTISHSSTNDIEKLKPFKPFAKNSSGNYSILIYNGKEGLGDIIIDCGFTKCFLSMEINETFRYIQNLVCFPMFKYLNEKNELWKPNSLNFNIESKDKYEFKHILYLIDIEEDLFSNDKN
jgi:hypothetical protein